MRMSTINSSFMKHIIVFPVILLMFSSCAKSEETRTLSGVITFLEESDKEVAFEISPQNNGCFAGKENNCIFTASSSLMKDYKDQDCVDIEVTDKNKVVSIQLSEVYFQYPHTLRSFLTHPVSLTLDIPGFEEYEPVLIEDETEIKEILNKIGDIIFYEDYILQMGAGGYPLRLTFHEEDGRDITFTTVLAEITSDDVTYGYYYDTGNPIHEYLYNRYFH